jgi:Fe-S oxidoreductase
MNMQPLQVVVVNPSIGSKIPEVLYDIWRFPIKFGQKVPVFDYEEVKRKLKEIREYTAEHVEELLQKLEDVIAEQYPYIKLIHARDATEAVRAIMDLCGVCKVSINKSCTVEELRDELVRQGFEIEETYYQEFEGFKPLSEKIPYWKLPKVEPEVKWRSYVPTYLSLGGIETMPRKEGKEGKVALLGINAISAEDGAIFFMEHSRNITNCLREASHVIFLAGLEKIVRNREDALFQTLCVGLFGFEGITAELRVEGVEKISNIRIQPNPHNSNPQISIILLDNGRSSLKKDFKELLYCIGCRVCNSVCPSFLTYKSVFEGPRNWIRMFNEVFGATKVAVGSELVWSCRTCKACEERCPLALDIKQVEKFIKIRERLVEEARISPTLRDALNFTYLYGNPWGRARSKRGEWASKLDVERFNKNKHDILYFVGCAPSYDTRCQNMAISLSRIFRVAGLKFGILGEDETCCAAEMRRIGERGLFEELSQRNKELFKKEEVKKIVTTSPHCFNTFKNEYGISVEVMHYTQLLAKLIHKIPFKRELNYKVTFHDPCYLGRYNRVFEEPRKILNSIPGLKLMEMPANREDSLCCGGGGGHMWIEWPYRPKPSEIRIKQAIEVGADTLAVACPFCLSMLEDAVKTLGYEDKIRVKDISELVVEAITVY